MNKTKSKATAWSAGIVGAAIVAIVLWNAIPTATTVDTVEITPVGTTDETEFLLYSYGQLRNEIPATVHQMASPSSHCTWVSAQRSQALRPMSLDQMQKDLAELRDRVNRYHEYVKERGLNPKVQSLYSDLLEAIDITDDYLVQLDRIDRAILDLRSRQSAEAGYNTVLAGGYASRAAYENGAERGDAALTGIAAGMVTLFFEDMKNRQELDESKRQAFEDASEGFKRKMSSIQARETNRLSDFAQKYQWQRDKEGHLVDSFTKLEESLGHQYFNASTPNEALAACKAICDAARVVPAASVYDEHRAYALYWAARAATWAAEQELNGGKWGGTRAPSADVAVKLWDAAIRYAPADPAGLWRSQRAWALGIGGRFPEAMKQATGVFPLRQADPAFLYHYASLWSASGSPDQSTLANIRSAMSHESLSSDLFEPITLQAMKRDPNLAALRQKYSTEFDDLVKLKTEWFIDWGIISDDIRLVNNSAFPITNVKFDVTVKSTGFADWGPFRFEVARVDPGQTFRWKTKIKSRGNDSKGSGLLTADQSN